MEIRTALITCDCCKKMFMPGNDERGLPNGVGFLMDDGKSINLCSSCIMSSDFEAVLKFVKRKVDDDGKDDYECDGSGD